MLWRVRTTLADRPGTLATLARHCGERSLNILGMQIFPGVDGVTDELLLASPESWTLADVAELVEDAGGARVSVGACTEHALVDGPTHYLQAVRRVLTGADDVATVLAALLDAAPAVDPALAEERLARVQDTLEVDAGAEHVELRRTTPFTATERARTSAFAELVADLHERGLLPATPTPRDRDHPSIAHGELLVREASITDTAALMAMHQRCSQDTVYRHYGAPLARLDLRLARRILVGEGKALVAVTDARVVGLATVSETVEGRAELGLMVEDRHQRRGIGTRLLAAATRQAAVDGADDLVLRGPAESPAAIAMVFGSGLRARVRLTGDELVVTISTRGLATERPLATVTPVAPT